jgi:nicotinate phosphoribosyltransferase
MKDGEIAFPNEPIVSIHAPLLEAQVLETPILSIINHAMLVATKASRIYRASKGIPVISMGTRRAHGLWAGIYGDESAFIGGCTNVSNILTDIKCGVPSVGTMSHSYIESYGIGKEAEYQAFRDFVEVNPVKSNILLIDTYDTIKCGLPNAIKVFKKFNLEEKNDSYGIRLDSGDLAYLSKYCRKELDEAGCFSAKIIASNGLDEYSISELLNQDAKIDIFGVGDAIATSKHNPCFGGVYKLAKIGEQSTIKLSEDTIKVINPDAKNVVRIIQNGQFKADIIYLKEKDEIFSKLIHGEQVTIKDEFDKFKTTTFEDHSYYYESLLQEINYNDDLYDKRDYVQIARIYFLKNLESFSPECIRLTKPHSYKVDISDSLYKLKYSLIKQIKENM